VGWNGITVEIPSTLPKPGIVTDASSVVERHSVPPRERGGNAGKRQRVEQEMQNDIHAGRLTPNKLATMLEKEMAARYGVSRDTARKARNKILSLK
jgi:hypothetical protein